MCSKWNCSFVHCGSNVTDTTLINKSGYQFSAEFLLNSRLVIGRVFKEFSSSSAESCSPWCPSSSSSKKREVQRKEPESKLRDFLPPCWQMLLKQTAKDRQTSVSCSRNVDSDTDRRRQDKYFRTKPWGTTLRQERIWRVILFLFK